MHHLLVEFICSKHITVLQTMFISQCVLSAISGCAFMEKISGEHDRKDPLSLVYLYKFYPCLSYCSAFRTPGTPWIVLIFTSLPT